MIESFFGTTPSVWAGMPSIGQGWAFGLPVANRLPLMNVANSGLPLIQAGVPQRLSGYTAAELSVPSNIPTLLMAIAVRRGQPNGPATDQEVEEFIFDALEFLPGAGEVEVRCENGRVTLTGTTQHKHVKRDAGEIAWSIPVVADVQNNVTIATKRRGRATREGEQQSAAGVKK